MKWIAVVVLALMAQIVGAYEIPSNPDRFMSLGFNFGYSTQGGDYNWTTYHLKELGNFDQRSYIADLRIPLASWLTWTVGGGYLQTDLGLGIVSKQERWNMNGYALQTGVRLYLK